MIVHDSLVKYSFTGDAPSAGRGGRRAGWPEQPGEEREQEGARAAGQAGKEATQEEQGGMFGRITLISLKFSSHKIYLNSDVKVAGNADLSGHQRNANVLYIVDIH